MIANGFQPDAFVRNAEAIARVVRANEVFTLLARSVTPPPSCAALVWHDSSQPTLLQGGGTIASDGVREILFVKTLPFQLDYDIGGLSSKDGYEFSACVSMAVQAVPDRAELDQLRRQLLGSRNRADLADLRRHCEETVRTALARFVRDRDAANLIDSQCWNDFDAVLAEHFQPLGFASGLALGRDVRARFASPSYADARRQKDAQSRRQEQLSADLQIRAASQQARRQHLAELAVMIDQVKAAAAKEPNLAVSDLIKSFDITRRGDLYRALLAASPASAKSESILVVAGQELLWFTPARVDKPTRRQIIPDDLGPLRSVRSARRGESPIILVGARYGLHVFDAEGGSRQAYPFADRPDIRGGVNAATLLDDRFYATHSEVGLTCWELGRPSTPASCLQDLTAGCKSVRDVQTDAVGRIWLAADAKVIGWSPATNAKPIVLTAPSTVQSLALADDLVYAGLDNGVIVSWTAAEPHDMDLIRPPGGEPVHSLEWLSGGGAPRLLIADKRPYLTLQVLGDTYHAEYRWTQPLRWAFAAEDLIVGVSDSRDQLIFWRADTPEEPTATLPIGRLCGHSVQDVAILPSAVNATVIG